MSPFSICFVFQNGTEVVGKEKKQLEVGSKQLAENKQKGLCQTFLLPDPPLFTPPTPRQMFISENWFSRKDITIRS